jgi:hypothetical protein
MVAALLGVGGGPARVSLRAPPPVGRELRVVETEEGVELRDGDLLVAEGARAELDLEAAEPVDPERAAEASRAGYERWSAEHPFPTCFTCGPDRRPGDGLRLFPGPLGDGRFAAPWIPAASLADDAGMVRAQYVWAAIDCPTSAPVAEWGGQASVLARLHGRIDHPIAADAPHAIVSWALGVDGRKKHAACAVFDADGRPVARSRALWIELR